MFDRPSLRYFALQTRISQRLWGSVWQAIDRRDGKQYWLIKPNRSICWPRVMAAIEVHGPIPVKLRNNRVALLVPNRNDDRSLIRTISKSRGKAVEFDVFRGFQEKRVSKARLLILLALTLIIGSAFIPHPKPKADNQVQASTICNSRIKAGMLLEDYKPKGTSLSIEGEEFAVLSSKSFGGLLDLQIKRKCDSKQFKVRTWVTTKQQVISKVL